MEPTRSTVHMSAVIVLLAVVVLLQGWQVFQGVSAHRQQWQYAIESPKDEALMKRLGELGADGWEVVSARRATSSEPDGKASYEMIMRRPLSSADTLVPSPFSLPDVPAPR